VNSSGPFRDSFRELIEAYALGALDADEHAAVAAHLATGCADCTRVLAESRWIITQLAYLAPDATPSDMLRRRLMQTVRAEATALEGAAAESQASLSPTSKSNIPFWIWATAAAVLLFAFYNSREARSLQEQMNHMKITLSQQAQLQQESERQLAFARREAAILVDSKSIKIPMPGAKNMPVLQATWNPDLGLVILGQKLPVLPANRTLQLWLIPKAPGAKPVPSLTMRPDANGTFNLLVIKLPDSPNATKTLAITEEPESGSSQPTTTPVWVGALAAK